MLVFNATIPIHFEHDSPYDTHDFTTNIIFEFSHSFIHQNMFINIDVRGNAPRQVTIDNIEAIDEINAFIIVKSLMPYIVQCISLYFQSKNLNQHYGHVRMVWYKKEVSIHSRDISSNQMTISLSIDKFEDNLAKIILSNALQFLSQALYNSLQSQDLKSKFYNAFTIIEYVENEYRNIGTKRFKKDINKIIADYAYNEVIKDSGSEDDANKAKSFVMDALSKPTIQNRAEKLAIILNEKYSISQIEYPTPQTVIEVNENLTNELIRIRNSLFHGKSTKFGSNELKRYTDLLILICTKITLTDLDIA